MSLDRSLDFGIVGGAYFGAAYYQNGHYFGADGTYLFSNPGLAPPPGCKPAVACDENGPIAAADEPEAVEATEAAPAEQAIQQAEGLTREQDLAQKHLGTLRALVAAAGGDPITGSGAKARMVEWLIANTQ